MPDEFWTPEPIWRGETAFVLASGPSLTKEVAERVRRRHTIAVNSSVSVAPFAEVLYFTDGSWYEPRMNLVKNFPGLVCSMCRKAAEQLPDKVRRVKGEGDPTVTSLLCPLQSFPPVGSPVIRQGRSSGHTAIALAVALGASRIGLLGFDMRVIETVDAKTGVINLKEHCHDEYDKAPRDLKVYEREFLIAFAGWNAAALKSGVQILNATPGSAIKEFPFADLDEILRA